MSDATSDQQSLSDLQATEKEEFIPLRPPTEHNAAYVEGIALAGVFDLASNERAQVYAPRILAVKQM